MKGPGRITSGSLALGKRFQSPVVFNADNVVGLEPPIATTPRWLVQASSILFRKNESLVEGFFTS
jgi:hypothetical protein